jgi:2C-methyl-D-erythritol 2,4-cyclodiphosphate synthase
MSTGRAIVTAIISAILAAIALGIVYAIFDVSTPGT